MGEDFADLAALAFLEGDFDLGVGGLFLVGLMAQEFYGLGADEFGEVGDFGSVGCDGGRGFFVSAVDDLMDAAHFFVGEFAFECDVIAGLYAVHGVGEALREFAVVGDEHQACGVDVEAADGEEASGDGVWDFDQVHDGGASFGVAGGGDDLAGLVEDDVGFFEEGFAFGYVGEGVFFAAGIFAGDVADFFGAFGAGEHFAADFDVVDEGVDPGGECGDFLTVHAYEAFGDELFAESA